MNTASKPKSPTRTFRFERQGSGVRGQGLGGSYTNEDVRNLRFIPNRILGRSNLPSHISFEENGKTRSFAWAVAEAEALALFGKMDETYKFPRGRTA